MTAEGQAVIFTLSHKGYNRFIYICTKYKDFHPTEKDNVVIATVEYGNGAVVHVPPTNFNPLTATDEQLDYYNYPRRPKNEADLKHWQDVISHAKHFVIPVFGEGGNDCNCGERK